LDSVREEAVMVLFEVLSRHFPGLTEEKPQKLGRTAGFKAQISTQGLLQMKQ
jgi:hypothetical protein